MSNYNSLKSTIDANIKQNGRQEITGQILNSVLNQMVTTLGAGYQFAGVATTTTNPGTPDAKVFYIANGKGTYTNFGGIEVTEDEVVVLYWDTAWHKVSTGIASQEKLTELESQTSPTIAILKSSIYGNSIEMGNSIDGYINSRGEVKNVAPQLRHFEVDVEEDTTYIIVTRLGLDTVYYGVGTEKGQINGIEYLEQDLVNSAVLTEYKYYVPKGFKCLYISYCTESTESPYTSLDDLCGVYKAINTLNNVVDTTAEEASRNSNLLIGNSLPLGSPLKGYVRYNGVLTLDDANLFRAYIIKVEVGKKYLVRTTLNDVSAIAGGETENQSENLHIYVTGETNRIADYVIKAKYPYLFITNMDAYGECYATEYSNSLVNKVNELVGSQVKATPILGDSITGYVTTRGQVKEATPQFRHFEVEVTIGETYRFTTRLGTDTVYIGGGNQKGMSEGLYVYPVDRNSYDQYAEYIITAQYRYLYISYETDAAESPYTQYDYLCSISRESELKEYFVGFGNDTNNGYYESLVDCFWDASRYSGKKKIHIAEGVYNIFEELGGYDYVNQFNADTDDYKLVQPMLYDVEIIGYGNAVLEYNPTESYSSSWLFSPLNIIGNAKVENIEIRASNCRYGIHDEDNAIGAYTSRTYTNVRVFTTGNVRPMGCGCSNCVKQHFKDCYLESGYESVYSCHGAPGAVFIFDNCVLKGVGGSGGNLRISQVEYCEMDLIVNNSIVPKITLSPEVSGRKMANGVSVRLVNTHTTIENKYTDGSNADCISYNTITGETNILLSKTL